MKTKRLVVMALVFGFLVVCASAARVEAANKFFYIGSGTTADKPQSKLWFHDGTWWAILPDGNVSGLYFYRMVDGTFVKQTFTDAKVDAKTKYRADVLQGPDVGDIPTLFVLVYQGSGSGLLRKYRYNTATQEYYRTPGFPIPGVSLPFTVATVGPDCLPGWTSGAETTTIAQDTTGKLWIAYETTDKTVTPNVNKIRVIWSTSTDHAQWNTCGYFIYPASPTDPPVGSGDIAALTAFTAGTPSNPTTPTPQVGVMWSNQPAVNFGFRTHVDGQLENSWESVVVPAQGSNIADDHVHLTVTPTQDILATTKSRVSDSTNLFVRWASSGQWVT